ncbi:HEAT repeat domain-containing protein [Skermanella sp. TT6]|uniref:HEAT repeat domain-containing protein n=1 Tax=Skermanella cutis TaxID=2775420 RepID=A0ABX7B2P9_9PROT|nr:HEAT repeat domain-containing protein [Skermanella sp. TT6]QQP88099.1 HEAT repeat domain-containing protein [Skermanella sp. TT6]
MKRISKPRAGRLKKRVDTGQGDLFAQGQGTPVSADPPPVPAAETPPPRPIGDWPTGHLLDALNLHLHAEPPAHPSLIATIDELAKRREPEAARHLITTCRRFAAFDQQQPAPEVVAALDALARIGPPSAAVPLIDLIRRGLFGPASTAAALDCFGALRCRPAADLIRPNLEHPHPRVRQSACGLAAALDRRDDASLLAPLLNDPDRGVAKAARLALGELGHAPAREPLEELLDRATPIDIPRVARALVAVADDDTPVKLARAADRCDEEGRCAIVAALGAMEQPGAVTQLIRLSRDTRPAVRLAVIEALSNHEDKRIPAALGTLSHDADPAVRDAAEAALRSFDASPDW